MANRVTNVVIVGCTGQVGKAITAALLATGTHNLTALTRSSSASSASIPAGLKISAVTSYEDVPAVTAALKAASAHALVISLGITAPPTTQGALIDAAAAAGVKYVIPNWWGGDPTNARLCEESMFFANAVSARDAIARARQSGNEAVKLLFVACSFWYEYSLSGGPDRFGFDFTKKTVRLMDGGKTRISVSTWPQTGRAVAAALSLPISATDSDGSKLTLTDLVDSDSQTLYVSSFLVSQAQMLESVKRVTGTTDADWTIENVGSEPQYKAALQAVMGGDRSAFARMLYSRTFFPNGDGDFDAKKHNRLLGLAEEEDLDEATREAVRMAGSQEVPYTG